MSLKTKVYNQKVEEVGEIKLTDKIFGIEVHKSLVHQAMVTQMSNERQVLAHTKDRSEKRGGGRKPWRQKGTGRARAGSTRSPIWIGGGVTFGPTKDRNFKKKINKKMKQKALFMVLSDKVLNKSLVVLDKVEIKDFKTKVVKEILDSIDNKIFKLNKKSTEKSKKDIDKKTPQTRTNSVQGKRKQKRSLLIINDKKDDKVKFSTRNLAGVEIINLNNINILDLLKYKNIILTKQGIKKLEEKYS